MKKFIYCFLLILAVCVGGGGSPSAIAQTCINAPVGLVSWWPGDGNAKDIVGPNDGTLFNGAAFAPGLVGPAFRFDGVDEFMDFPETAITSDLQELTVDVWVKHDSLPAQIERYITLGGPQPVVLRHNGSGQLHFFLRMGGVLHHVQVNGVLQVGVFHHVAGTFDGSIMRLYLDGVEVGSLAVSGTIAPPTFGFLSSSDESLDGLLDEVEFFDRALTAPEIAAIYNAGSAGKCKEIGEVLAMSDVNGNNNTDLGVLLRDPETDRNKLYVMDGGGNNITTVPFGPKLAKGSTTVPDATGDLVPEFGVLLEGSLFARVKDVVNGTKVGEPSFNTKLDPVALLSVGDVGGGAGPDVVLVGRHRETGKVQAVVKDVASGNLVKRMNFSKAFVPFAAVAVDNVGDSAAMEIAVLGIDANGNVQAQVKDAQSGNLINKIQFNKKFTPLYFAAVPNTSGKLKHLAVLGRNESGVIQAQVKRVSNGTLVNTVKFNKSYDPRAFISFADSNGSGGGEVGVVGVNANGVVRAQVKEIADGTLVNVMNFNRKYPPLDAIAVTGVAGTAQNEIAVLGENVSGQLQLQIKDLLSGDLVINFPVP